MNNYSRTQLSYISNDIIKLVNPIKFYNKYFDKNWTNNEVTIKNFFKDMYNVVVNVMNELNSIKVNDYLTNTFTFNPTYHVHPFIYQKYVKNNNITYDDFKMLYYKHKILIDYNYNQYFKDYPTDVIQLFNLFEKGKFNDLDIKLYVENNINKCSYYNFTHLNLYYFYTDTPDIELVKECYVVTKWLHNMNPLYKIKLLYFDTPLKKNINYDYDFLSSMHVNSGLTLPGKYIIIWRREELIKVIIHELIHYLNLDVKHDDKFDNIIKYNFGYIKTPIIVNETITEMQAQILHSVYVSIVLCKGCNDNDKSYEYFKTIYNYELIYSWYQYAKILSFYKIDEYNLNNLIMKFNQSSNVYSYYVLKVILSLKFSNIIFALDHFNKNNNKQCNINRCDILVKRIKNMFNKSHSKYNNILNKLIHLNNNDTSLRMTIFGSY